MVQCKKIGTNTITVQAISDSCIRFRLSSPIDHESGLSRYGIFEKTEEPAYSFDETDDGITIKTKNACLFVKNDGNFEFSNGEGKLLLSSLEIKKEYGGFDARISYNDGAKIYGLGDSTRREIDKNGFSTEMFVQNIRCYVPVPFLHSGDGWGLLLNSTWRHTADIGKREKDVIRFVSRGGEFDIYLFAAKDAHSAIDQYTRLVGRPIMLPKWAYGLSYVANQANDINATMNDCLNFRREDIPCDLVGLEPGWTAGSRYHFATDKKWSPEKYPLPEWQKGNKSLTFLGAMERINFRLSLWLCIEYDLSYEEERLIGNATKKDEVIWDDDDYVHDSHFETAARIDGYTKIDEPFFEHLKRFVDDGVECFKLDGCHQIDEHPDRRWGNGMTDEEMHNLFPLIYAKQMSLGYRKHTGKRAMIYTPSGYAGIQKYAATWAGDTGGGPKPLVSMLNLGYVGHSNVSCDMDVDSYAGIHFGFMQAWSQHSNWAYWNQPWFIEKDKKECFRFYAKLRYRLAPYIYTMAHKAHVTGLPMMRAMSLEYPDMQGADELMCQYMFGDEILTSAFVDAVTLPSGEWTDAWTGEHIAGGSTVKLEHAAPIGGGLYVRDGAIIPTIDDVDHLGTDAFCNITFNVYPCKKESEFTLYDDDGATYGYENAEYTETKVTAVESTDGEVVTIYPRSGSFDGMPEKCGYTVKFYSDKEVSSAYINGSKADVFLADGWCETGDIKAYAVKLDSSCEKTVIEFKY